MNSREYRDKLLSEMVAAYREVRRLERKLTKPPFTRKFKNALCKSAISLEERRGILHEEIEGWKFLTIRAFDGLPENRDHDGTIGEAMAFAKSLTKKPRKPRFLKNQRRLIES